MYQLLILLIVTVASVHGSGEFTVLHHPSSISFKGHDRINEGLLKEVYTAALGFTIEQESNWQGMYLNDPFNLVEAIVTVEVDGVSSIEQVKGHHFPLITNSESNTYQSLKKRVQARYPAGDSNLLNVDLAEGIEAAQDYEIFKNIKDDKVKVPIYKHLKVTVDEDREFLKQISLLFKIAEEISEGSVKPNFVPDVYWYKVSGLHGLIDLHGENSTVAKEAKQLLNEVVLRLNKAFDIAYKGSVLVSVVVSDSSHTRRSRSILAAATKADEAPADAYSQLNLAKSYSSDYPVIFNIILWFGVIWVFSLLAIALAIGNMDPGRDSIIYRMTSTRMKKDN